MWCSPGSLPTCTWPWAFGVPGPQAPMTLLGGFCASQNIRIRFAVHFGEQINLFYLTLSKIL